MGRRKKNREKSRPAVDGAGFGGSFGDLLRASGLAPSGSAAAEPSAAEPSPAEPSPAEPSGATAADLSALGKLIVRRTRKGRGGRTVTLIEGLDDLPERERRALAAAARKALGTGARLEETTVAVQGDVGPRLADWLRARGARRVIVS